MQHLVWQIFLKRKRSLMWGEAGSDMLCRFQSRDETSLEFCLFMLGMNLARRLHSILIGDNEYWLILSQVLLQPEAVARGARETAGYVPSGPAFLLCGWRIAAACIAAQPQGSNQESRTWGDSGAAVSWGSLGSGRLPGLWNGHGGAVSCDEGGGLVLKAVFCSEWDKWVG